VAGNTGSPIDHRCTGVMGRFEARVEVKLYYDGALLLDEEGARLLQLIRDHGSLLAASRIIGIPYSRVWEMISRIERVIGERIIERRRGAKGGARLTPAGERLLQEYARSYARLTGRIFSVEGTGSKPQHETRIIYAGSHDILVSRLLDTIIGAGNYELHWIGSINGIVSLLLREASITGIHILDTTSGEYNIPFLKKYYGGSGLLIVRGWERSIGLASRINKTLEDLLRGIVRGELRIVNRNPGSGSRILLDNILDKAITEAGLDPRDKRRIVKDYDTITYTHTEVAETIASGEADVGVCIEYVARSYGLKFHRIRWEKFDLLFREEDKALVDRISRIIRDKGLQIKDYPGYRLSKDSGLVMIV
jgi:putative molybdopterin biosynthesis protein